MSYHPLSDIFLLHNFQRSPPSKTNNSSNNLRWLWLLAPSRALYVTIRQYLSAAAKHHKFHSCSINAAESSNNSRNSRTKGRAAATADRVTYSLTDDGGRLAAETLMRIQLKLWCAPAETWQVLPPASNCCLASLVSDTYLAPLSPSAIFSSQYDLNDRQQLKL